MRLQRFGCGHCTAAAGAVIRPWTRDATGAQVPVNEGMRLEFGSIDWRKQVFPYLLEVYHEIR